MTALNTTPTSPIPARRVHIPIRIKITVPYMILSLLVAAVVAYLTTQLVIENIQERFDKQLYEAGKISSELIVSYETQLLETQSQGNQQNQLHIHNLNQHIQYLTLLINLQVLCGYSYRRDQMLLLLSFLPLQSFNQLSSFHTRYLT